MPRSRSSVLRGRVSQRDRACKRRKDRPSPRPRDTAPRPDAAARETLRAWIDEHLDLYEFVAIERLDLRAFLRATAAVAIEPEERLRVLAIEAESTCASAPQPRGWRALDRIYQAALALRQDAYIHASRMISAQQCMQRAQWAKPPQREVARALFEAGRAAGREAIRLAPDEVHPHSALAQLHYFSEHASAEQALARYDRALEIDPAYGWALLFRAHCLHDLERWAEAAAAYDAVPRQHYQGRVAWRYIVALERRASCLLRAGRREEALAAFRDVLDRIARDPKLVEHADLRMLVDAARGPLLAELRDAVDALLRSRQRAVMLARLHAAVDDPRGEDDP